LSDPLHAPSRQRLRTLRTRASLSPGVQVTVRRGGRASGSSVYYSALSALSAKAQGAGDVQVASGLARAAAEVEAWVAPALCEFLSSRSVEELSEAPFYAELLNRTRVALERNKVGFVLMTGRVEGFDGDSARVVAESEPRRHVDLPESLLRDAGAGQGDYVWIMREVVGSAAVLTVLVAVAVQDEGPVRGRRYLEDGAGAPISEAEARFFRDRPRGTLPTARVLRPAG